MIRVSRSVRAWQGEGVSPEWRQDKAHFHRLDVDCRAMDRFEYLVPLISGVAALGVVLRCSWRVIPAC